MGFTSFWIIIKYHYNKRKFHFFSSSDWLIFFFVFVVCDLSLSLELSSSVLCYFCSTDLVVRIAEVYNFLLEFPLCMSSVWRLHEVPMWMSSVCRWHEVPVWMSSVCRRHEVPVWTSSVWRLRPAGDVSMRVDWNPGVELCSKRVFLDPGVDFLIPKRFEVSMSISSIRPGVDVFSIETTWSPVPALVSSV